MKYREQMGEDSGKPDAAEARRMLDICASVGARAVDLTLTSQSGEKEYFRRNQTLAELGRLPASKATNFRLGH